MDARIFRKIVFASGEPGHLKFETKQLITDSECLPRDSLTKPESMAESSR